MTKYEYRTELYDTHGFIGGKVDSAALDKNLNAMGAEGWELVSLAPSTKEGGSTKHLVAVFKRPL